MLNEDIVIVYSTDINVIEKQLKSNNKVIIVNDMDLHIELSNILYKLNNKKKVKPRLIDFTEETRKC